MTVFSVQISDSYFFAEQMNSLQEKMTHSVFREHVVPFLPFKPTKTARIIQEAIIHAIIAEIETIGESAIRWDNMWKIAPSYALCSIKAYLEGDLMDIPRPIHRKLQTMVTLCVLSESARFMEFCRYMSQRDSSRYWRETYDDYVTKYL